MSFPAGRCQHQNVRKFRQSAQGPCGAAEADPCDCGSAGIVRTCSSWLGQSPGLQLQTCQQEEYCRVSSAVKLLANLHDLQPTGGCNWICIKVCSQIGQRLGCDDEHPTGAHYKQTGSVRKKWLMPTTDCIFRWQVHKYIWGMDIQFAVS